MKMLFALPEKLYSISSINFALSSSPFVFVPVTAEFIAEAD